MESIKRQQENLKAETKRAVIDLANQSCVVEMKRFQIRQSFSYYEDEVYHADTAYIDQNKGTARILLEEYADSIPLEKFYIENQIGLYEELAKLFSNSKYNHRIYY